MSTIVWEGGKLFKQQFKNGWGTDTVPETMELAKPGLRG